MATIPCVCPPKRIDETGISEVRHPDGDTVTLRERLDFRAALTARNAVNVLKVEDPQAGAGEVLAVLTEAYLIGGIESWTLVHLDAEDRNRLKALPVSRATVRAFMADHVDEASLVGDEADELYSKAVLGPLVARASGSLPVTPTPDSTSPTTKSSETLPKRSKQSSITTIPTGGTEQMSASRGGGYS